MRANPRTLLLRLLAPPLTLAALLLPALGAAQTLIYEREYTLIGEADRVLRIELDASDRMLVERPRFMTHPGRHELQAPAGSYARLARMLNVAAPQARGLSADLERRAANELKVVTDEEIVRIRLVDEARGVQTSVLAISPGAWARLFDDEPRLQALAALDQAWLELMEQGLRGGAQ